MIGWRNDERNHAHVNYFTRIVQLILNTVKRIKFFFFNSL